MAAIIQIQQLLKKYPNGTEALKGVDLEIHQGRFFTLLGPNGAGKSTLVKILTTLIQKDSGTFFITGRNPENDFLKIQHLIGVASQENEIDPCENCEKTLIFQGRLFGMTTNEARKRADSLIDMFELNTEKGKKAGMLSGGNKRRLHCALALVHHPKILFLDEPTVGMDPVARANFWEVIKGLNTNDGTTVFLTTQYLEEADKHATEMALLVNGKIEYAGSIDGFKNMVTPGNNMTLDESYLLFLKKFNHHENLKNKKEEIV